MNSLNEAEKYLLQQVRNGDESIWSEMIGRYQGRLQAFALGQLHHQADADDAVQETFVSFLKSLDRFQAESSLETFLFTILRRRIVDVFRKQGANSYVHVCQVTDKDSSNASDLFLTTAQSREPTSSWYVRNSEAIDAVRQVLWSALHQTIQDLKQKQRIRDLQIFEMIFFAGMKNNKIASIFELDEKKIALTKHRLIKRISKRIPENPPEDLHLDAAQHEDLISNLWVEHRPTCPKRSTLGKFMLGTLDDDWLDYVANHLRVIQCNFCIANFKDMERKSDESNMVQASQRILQSSIGFLPDDGPS